MLAFISGHSPPGHESQAKHLAVQSKRDRRQAGASGLERAVLVQRLDHLQEKESERQQWIDGGPERGLCQR